MSETLFVVDVILMVIGGLGCAVAVVVWLARGRRDPLRGAPLRPNSLDAADVLLCVSAWALCFGMAESVLNGLLALAGPDDQRQQLIGSLSNDVAQIGGGAACLLVGSVAFRGGWRTFGLTRRSPLRDIPVAIICYVPIFPICMGLAYGSTWVIRLLRPAYELPKHPVLKSLEWLTGWPEWLLIAGAVIVAPVAEELFFRGLIQTGLKKLLRSRWLAIAGTGLIFGAIHWQPDAVLALAALGAAMGFLYEKTGSLVPAILVHALFNAKNILWTQLLT